MAAGREFSDIQIEVLGWLAVGDSPFSGIPKRGVRSLKSLEKAGLIRTHETGGRINYSLTEAGRREWQKAR